MEMNGWANRSWMTREQIEALGVQPGSSVEIMTVSANRIRGKIGELQDHGLTIPHGAASVTLVPYRAVHRISILDVQ